MVNKLPEVNTSALPAKGEMIINVNGNSNTFVGSAEKVNNTTSVTNILLASTNSLENQTGKLKELIELVKKLDYECYNLFVISGEEFSGKYFIVSKDRALTESTNSGLKAKYAGLSEKAIAKIKTFPAIFADENRLYGKAEDSQIAHYGIITDIKIQDNGIKVYFECLTDIRQQILNELKEELGISYATAFNELNRTHWALKQINLVEALNKNNIKVFTLR